MFSPVEMEKMAAVVTAEHDQDKAKLVELWAGLNPVRKIHISVVLSRPSISGLQSLGFEDLMIAGSLMRIGLETVALAAAERERPSAE